MRGFAPGTPKPKNSGRRKGTPNKRSVLEKQAGEQGLKSAIEICRTGGDDPISIIVNASRFLNKIAEAFMPQEGSIEGMDFREIILNTPRTDLDFMRKFLMDASALAYKAAEFGYAKLARIDHVGDVPQAPTVENRMVFTLNIDGGQAPGRPVIDVDPTEDD